MNTRSIARSLNRIAGCDLPCDEEIISSILADRPQKKQEEEQKKKWAEEKKMRNYEGMFTDEAIDAYHAELSDDDFM